MTLKLVTFLLLSTHCFSQEHYEFDYFIETEHIFYKDSIKIKDRQYRQIDTTISKYYLTNSKQNNYQAVITEEDSLHYRLVFTDRNGIYSNVTFLKSELPTAKILNIQSKHKIYASIRSRNQIKSHGFNKLSDTIINGDVHCKYKLELFKSRKIKRKKLGAQYVIIKNGTSFHQPIFSNVTAYNYWKKEGNLPNGIFLEKYDMDANGQLYSHEKLIDFKKTNRTIIFNTDCD